MDPCATAGSERLVNTGAPAPGLDWKGLLLHEGDARMCVRSPMRERLLSEQRALALGWEGNGSDGASRYNSLVTQLVNPLWSVRIAEKVRMGLPCPRLVLAGASAMPVVNRRVVLLRGMKYGIARMSLTCFVRSWDHAIPIRNNTWVNIVSDPMSCS